MKINIFRQEEGDRFYITFAYDENQGTGFAFTLSTEDLKTLGEKISAEIQEMNKPKEEMVWNPRSQRHEIKRK